MRFSAGKFDITRNIAACGHWLATKAIRADGCKPQLRSASRKLHRFAALYTRVYTCVYVQVHVRYSRILREWGASITGCEVVRASPALGSGLSGISKGARRAGNACATRLHFARGAARRREQTGKEIPAASFVLGAISPTVAREETHENAVNLRRSIWTFRFIYLPPSVIISG